MAKVISGLSRAKRLCASLAAGGICFLHAPCARSNEASWRDDFGRVNGAEIALGVTGLSASALSNYVLPEPRRWWDGMNPFDEAIRDALRASNQDTRDTMAGVSDGLFYGLVAYPVVVDAVSLTWIARGDADSAGQLLLLDLMALGAGGLIATLAEYSGRARPYVRTCDREGADGNAKPRADTAAS